MSFDKTEQCLTNINYFNQTVIIFDQQLGFLTKHIYASPMDCHKRLGNSRVARPQRHRIVSTFQQHLQEPLGEDYVHVLNYNVKLGF